MMRPLTMMTNIICCPKCKKEISLTSLDCLKCGSEFKKNGDQLIFDESWENLSLAEKDWLNSVKEKVKLRFTWLYPSLVSILGPVAPTINPLKLIDNKVLEKGVVVNLGCGTTQLDAKIINVDQAPYTSVDIVASITNLPFIDGSIDTILNIAVLEHMADPKQIVEEFWRVLKPGGSVVCFIPFIQGIHASPFDFQRLTPAGIRELFTNFEIDLVHSVGPTSGLLWVLQEWLAMFFSFGSVRLYKILIPLTWIFSPIKYLDFIMRHHTASSTISTGFFFVARKKNNL